MIEQAMNHSATGWRVIAMRVCLFGVFVLLSLFPVTDLRADTSNLVIGARAQGMGSAFTALSDDAHGTFWNPAGLTRLSKSELAYTYWTLSDVSNIGVNFAALATPLEFGALNAAIGFSVVRVGDFAKVKSEKDQAMVE